MVRGGQRGEETLCRVNPSALGKGSTLLPRAVRNGTMIASFPRASFLIQFSLFSVARSVRFCLSKRQKRERGRRKQACGAPQKSFVSQFLAPPDDLRPRSGLPVLHKKSKFALSLKLVGLEIFENLSSSWPFLKFIDVYI